jgi:hypothetical protein
MKTSELTGAALDWAVAKCERQKPSANGEAYLYEHRVYLQDFSPSELWAQGGPIIEREKLSLFVLNGVNTCRTDYEEDIECTGPTPLIAAMRCYLSSKLGDEIAVPEELN